MARPACLCPLSLSSIDRLPGSRSTRPTPIRTSSRLGVVLALRQVAAGVGQAALDVLTTGPSPEVLAAALLRAVEELPADSILVLDDFHVLDESPAAQALVDAVLARAAPGLHLVVASRTRPPLPEPAPAARRRARPSCSAGRPCLPPRRGARPARRQPSGSRRRGSSARARRANRGMGGGAEPGRPGRASAAACPRLPARRARSSTTSPPPCSTACPRSLQDFALHTSVLFELTPAALRSGHGPSPTRRVPGRTRGAQPLPLPARRERATVPVSPAVRRVPAGSPRPCATRARRRAAPTGRLPPGGGGRGRPGRPPLSARRRVRRRGADATALPRRAAHRAARVRVPRPRAPPAPRRRRRAALAPPHGCLVVPVHRRLRAGTELVAPGHGGRRRGATRISGRMRRTASSSCCAAWDG